MGRLRGSVLAPELVVGLLGTVVFIVWAAEGGGSRPTTWYPGALFLLGLLAVALFMWTRLGDAADPPNRTVVVAIALLGLYAAWNLLSITWADVKGDAWDGANRTVLYFTVFTLFAIPRWSPRTAALTVGVYAVGVAVVAGATMLDLTQATDPTLSFIAGSLAEPTGYHNATAALFLTAFFPAAFLASRREVHWALRGLLLAAAGLLVEMAIPAQSRGSAIVFPIALIVYIAFVPNRVRAVIALLPLGLVAGVAASSLLDIYTVIQEGGDVTGAVDAAGRSVWISLLVLFAGGCGLGLVDRRFEIPAAAQRWSARIAGGVAAIAAVAAVALALVAIGNPADWAQARWDDFSSGYGHEDFNASRFSGDLGSNRYDFWRVAVDEFESHPITGVGADNFAVDYLRERRSEEEPQHPHSLIMRVLAQAGLVGVGLFGGFLTVAVVAVFQARSLLRGGLARGLPAAALASAAYWFGHSAGDWLWVFPAITAPALALLAMTARLAEGGPVDASVVGGERRRRLSSGRRRAIGAAVAAAVLLLTASYLLPWGAAEDVDSATASWRADPDGAFDRLDRASDLNFLSDEPDVLAGAIAERLHDRDRMRTSFEAALDRNPYSWYSWLELGALDAVEGRETSARHRLAEAAKLNPRDELIRSVRASVRRGRPVSLRSIDQALLDRVCARVGATDATSFCG